MGADYDMAATPGLEEGGHEYYTLAGAERLRDALADFGGGRVLVSVLGQPFKCPPAPFEGSFLLHEHFIRQGIRDAVQMATTYPMQRPVPVTGEVSQMFRDGLASRRIEELPQHLVTSIDPAARVAHLASGETLPYDLFVGIPVHRAPDPLAASGLAPDGWVPIDQANLRTRFPRVYAAGGVAGPPQSPQGRDFCRVGCSVIADDIAADISGGEPPAPYEASGVCYAEFGDGLVSKVDVNFLRERPRPLSVTIPRESTRPRRPSSARRWLVRAGSRDVEPAIRSASRTRLSLFTRFSSKALLAHDLELVLRRAGVDVARRVDRADLERVLVLVEMLDRLGATRTP